MVRWSFDLRAGLLHHVPPNRQVAIDNCGKSGARTRNWIEAKVNKFLADCRALEHLGDVLLQLRNDRGRRTSRREAAIAGGAVVAPIQIGGAVTISAAIEHCIAIPFE